MCLITNLENVVVGTQPKKRILFGYHSMTFGISFAILAVRSGSNETTEKTSKVRPANGSH